MQERSFKKGLVAFICGYLIWGFQPLYWNLNSSFDSFFLIANRIIWGAIWGIALLLIQGKMNLLIDAVRNRAILRRECFASLFLFANWLIYISAVTNGKVMETAFGYYIMPLLTFAFGAVVFKESVNRIQLLALCFVIIGIVLSVRGFGKVSYVALVLAISLPAYTAIKKPLGIDSTVSTAIEVLLMTPIAILYIAIFCRNETGLYALNLPNFLFLVGCGAITIIPIVLYTIGINNIPLTVASLFQYLSPTLSLICSTILGEVLTGEKLLSFAFIWIGIIIYVVLSLLNKDRKEDSAS